MVTWNNNPDSLDINTPNGFRNLGGIIKGASREEAIDLLLDQGLSPDRVETFLGSRGGSNWLRHPASEPNLIYPDLPAGVTVLRSGAVLQPRDQRSLNSRLEALGDLSDDAEEVEVVEVDDDWRGGEPNRLLPDGREVPDFVMEEIEKLRHEEFIANRDAEYREREIERERLRQEAQDDQERIDANARREEAVAYDPGAVPGGLGATDSEIGTSLIPSSLVNTDPGLPRRVSDFGLVNTEQGVPPFVANQYRGPGGQGQGQGLNLGLLGALDLIRSPVSSYRGPGAPSGSRFSPRSSTTPLMRGNSPFSGGGPARPYRGPGSPLLGGVAGAQGWRSGGAGSIRYVTPVGAATYQGPGNAQVRGQGFRTVQARPATQYQGPGNAQVRGQGFRTVQARPATQFQPSAIRNLPPLHPFRVPHAVTARSLSTYVPSTPFGLRRTY